MLGNWKQTIQKVIPMNKQCPCNEGASQRNETCPFKGPHKKPKKSGKYLHFKLCIRNHVTVHVCEEFSNNSGFLATFWFGVLYYDVNNLIFLAME